MTQPTAAQLYSVRDLLEQNYRATLDEIAGMNYLGVEMAGLYAEGSPAITAAEIRTDLQMEIVAAHLPLPLDAEQTRVLDTAAALGTHRIVCAYLPPEDFTTLDQIRRNCDRLNEADAVARAHGLRLYYHNHWWEYQRPDGLTEYPYRLMHEYLAPTIHYEIDAYWVTVGGCRPVDVLAELGERVTLLHVKDGPLTPTEPMLAVGKGHMNYHEVIPAARHAEWLIVELDRCATDMLRALNTSADYLSQNNLGRLR